jgi:SAM-dependent methyltransferase
VSTGGFSSAAGTYARARPSYARESIGILKDRIPDGPVLDLGAGTGILAGQLSRAGREVLAAEPLAEMLGQLRLSLPAVAAVACTAEALPFGGGRFSGVVVAQAFHWFDAPVALAEARRVLIPDGVLAMVFNVRDESVGWVKDLTDLIEARSGGRPYSDQRERSWEDVVADSGVFAEPRVHRFANAVPSSPASVLARVRSTSFVAVMPEEARESLIEEVRSLLADSSELEGRSSFDYPHHTELRLWTRSN